MGTAVHTLLEVCDLGTGPTEGEIAEVIEDEFGRPPEEGEVGRAGRLVRSFLESDLAARARDLEGSRPGSVARERRFLLRHEDLLVKGTIDLLLLPEEGHPVVIDYKSGSAKGDGAGADRYAMQMRIYSLAVEGILGRPPEAILFYLDGGLRREVPRDAGEVTRLFRRFRRAHEETPPGGGPDPHFPADPSPDRCRSCDFRRACPHRSGAP